MRKRRLGRTGLEVSEIGLGSIPVGQLPRDKALRVLHAALDAGVNYIDTARLYDDSESKIGEVMRTRRSEVYLATKSANRTREGFLRDLETSLRELGTDYVDVMQIHGINTLAEYEQVFAPDGAVAGLLEAQRAGKVRFLGFSSHNNEVMERVIPLGLFDTVLLVYNLAVHHTGERVIPLARKHDVGVLVMKPLSGGALVRLTGGAGGGIPAEAALRFVLGNPDVSCALVGMKYLRDVREAARVSRNFAPLSPEEEARYKAAAARLAEDVCGDCRYCAGCPAGIDIPGIMRLLDESRAFPYEWHQQQRAYQRFEKDFADCIDCGLCEKRCPLGLRIRERLAQARQRFVK